MMQSLELGGIWQDRGALFTVPAEVFDAVGAIGNGFGKKKPSRREVTVCLWPGTP